MLNLAYVENKFNFNVCPYAATKAFLWRFCFCQLTSLETVWLHRFLLHDDTFGVETGEPEEHYLYLFPRKTSAVLDVVQLNTTTTNKHFAAYTL